MSQTTTKVDVSLLKNDQLGYYTIQNDIVQSYITTEGPPPSGIADYGRSWWSCTRECISIHIACHMDRNCSTMLWITNVLSGLARPRGLGGSTSIGIACSAWCAADSKADLLPEY